MHNVELFVLFSYLIAYSHYSLILKVLYLAQGQMLHKLRVSGNILLILVYKFCILGSHY